MRTVYVLSTARAVGRTRVCVRGSRVTRVTRESVYTSGICTIKCGINTHEQKDRGGNLRGEGGGYGREQDGDRQRASLGDGG